MPVVLALLLRLTDLAHPDLDVVVGLALFGFPFAVNSSLHSYLILAYAGSEKAAEDVGFYYAANATGRLLGILLSGALYQVGGMTACLMGSAAMLVTCWLITLLLPVLRDRARRGAHGIIRAADCAKGPFRKEDGELVLDEQGRRVARL